MISMTKKKKTYEYHRLKEEKKEKRGYLKFIVAFAIALTLGLLALIGFNTLLLYSTTNIFLVLIVEALEQYAFFINCGLIFFVGFCGFFLALEASNYRTFKKRVISFQNLERPKEKAILQFLTNNKGKAFTSESLIKRINREGFSEEINSVLRELVEKNDIKRVVKNNKLYYSI